MKKTLLSGLLCVFAFVAAALAGDVIPVDALPKKVTAAVESYFPSAKIVSAKSETKRGRTVYEVHATYRNLLLEIDVNADGQVTEVESKND